MTIPVVDLFVSYKAEDRARVHPMVSALEAEGFSVWWDARIGGGTNWREDIQEHLEGAKCVIVVWTRRSVGPEGNFVRDEATRAQRRGVYLPVRLDAVEPPLGFGEVQVLSLKGWKGDRADPRFRELADAARSRISGEHLTPARAHIPQPRLSRRTAIAGGATAVALAGAGGWLLLKPAPANAKRIAVLPFANLSGSQDQAYFADGIAEELRSALSRIGLQVIGRNSCEAVKDLDIKTAAAKLDVAHILTGSVRRSPETIRVNAQLVGGNDGVERWAQTYDRAPGDAIKVQADIAASVAQALSIALGEAGRAALSLGGTADSVAQELILQSRQLGRGSSTADIARQRLALANAAIGRDSGYADAYVEKAIALQTFGVTFAPTPAVRADQLAQADAAAKKAIALAPRLGSAHAVLALVALFRLDFVGSLRESRLAVELSPEDAGVLSSVLRTVAHLESVEKALRLSDRAIALDPLNPTPFQRKSEVLTYLRRYPQAIDAGRKALELAPQVHQARTWVGDAFLLLGRVDQAKAEYAAKPVADPFRLTREAILAARTGDTAGAKRIMEQLKEELGAAASYQYGQIYAQLGDKTRAFAELDNAVQAKDPGLLYLKGDPFLDPIRGDPRYAALLRRLKFP